MCVGVRGWVAGLLWLGVRDAGPCCCGWVWLGMRLAEVVRFSHHCLLVTIWARLATVHRRCYLLTPSLIILLWAASLYSHTVTVTLIARRSWRRAGTRQWRRGADGDSSVANFVESEQLVEVDGAVGALASFVQVGAVGLTAQVGDAVPDCAGVGRVDRSEGTSRDRRAE